MPDIATRSSRNPEFARVLRVGALRRAGPFAFDVVAEPAEAEAVARLLGAEAVRKLRLRGALAPEGADGWRLDATLGATVTQSCVVSLEPVVTRIDAPVVRRYAPDATQASEFDPDAADEDEIDPLEAEIDLGLVAIEALALALPAYPRRPDARLEPAAIAPPGAAPLAEAEVRPFAALAALRAKPRENPGEDA